MENEFIKHLKGILIKVSQNLNISIKISVDLWKHKGQDETVEFKASFVPGLDGSDCSQVNFDTIDELNAYCNGVNDGANKCIK